MTPTTAELLEKYENKRKELMAKQNEINSYVIDETKFSELEKQLIKKGINLMKFNIKSQLTYVGRKILKFKNVSTKSVWECLKNGDDITKLLEGVPDEYFNKIKKYKDLLEAKFNFRKIQIDIKFETCMLFNKCSDDKTFALNIQDIPEKHYLFAIRKGRDITQMIWKELEPKYEKL